ncbi:MAG: GNAT family N-acetyltransferase [Chitinophagaceae bacterium]|nr:GNAT family N-acetyltransferase [Oligoflexus sp.]
MKCGNGLAYKIAPVTLSQASQTWRPKICFETKQGRYLVKIANTRAEFEATIRLRSEVFLREFAGKSDLDEIDIEERDQEADFLIIKDSVDGNVLACYRLISSHYSKEFYSNSEFSIQGFLKTPGHKLELSRACIRADKRTSGIFLHLLWKGLITYIQMSKSSFLFGCSSIPYLKLPELVNVYQSLREIDAFSEDYGVQPHAEYRIVDMGGILRFGSRPDREEKVPLPPLLMGYIKAGALVHGAPAFDQDFNCLDLFTILNFDREPSAFLKKYLDAQ